MRLAERPNIPIRKSPDEIQFYLDHGPKFGEILLRLKQMIEEGPVDNLKREFRESCLHAFIRHGIKFPFSKQENYLGEKFGVDICTSINNIVAHGRAHRMERGEIVSIDCGAALKYKGRWLHFDAAFTTICGLDTYNRDLVMTLGLARAPVDALKNIIKFQPMDTKGVSKIIQDTAKEHDLRQVVSLTGHGIGYMLHEEPAIHNAVGPFLPIELFDGLVFCAEPIFVSWDDRSQESRIVTTCIGSDGWEVSTIDGSIASHWETMFSVINGRIVDLIGISEWEI